MSKDFEITERTVWGLLADPGRCFYIPAYQRPYAWLKEDIERLLGDITDKLTDRETRKKGDATAFIGSIILVGDTRFKAISPIDRPHTPSAVVLVVDGQQRIVTLTILNMRLHALATEIKEELEANEDGELCKPAIEAATTLAKALERTFLLDMDTGDGTYQYYPKIAIAYQDTWSRRKNTAKYNSPIASYIWEYKNDDPKSSTKDAEHKNFRKAIDHLNKLLDSCLKSIFSTTTNNHVDGEAQELIEKLGVSPISVEFSDDFKELCTEKSPIKSVCTRLLKVIAFAKYTNNMTKVIEIKTDNEEKGFEIFEAMNTTGQPLTALETFKSVVINDVAVENYETHEVREYFKDRIQPHIDEIDIKSKATETANMIISFALGEKGERLSTHLAKQRRWLEEHYMSNREDDAKLQCVERLSHLAWFRQYTWRENYYPGFHTLTELRDQPLVTISLQFLSALKHTILIAPFFQFYSRALIAEERGLGTDLKKNRLKALYRVVCASAAFSTLWRTAYGGTAGIEDIYRDATKDFVAKKIISGEELAVDGYIASLCSALQEAQIYEKSRWIEKAKTQPIYKTNNAPLAKFLLLLASDDAIVDDKYPGLIKKGKTGISPTLTTDSWQNLNYFTVEHVAPKKPPAGHKWDKTIYPEGKGFYVNFLGNLILLPADVNSSIKNSKSWEVKRKTYKKLSSSTVADDTESQTSDVIRKAPYLKLCKAAAEREKDWDHKFIMTRTERLMDLAYDRIINWLK